MAKTRKEKGHYGRVYLRMRAEVLASEPFCYLCEQWINPDLHYLDPGAPQLHLIVPLAKGGSWRDRSNCRATHRLCNRKQSDQWDGAVSHGPELQPWVADEEP